MQAIEEGPALPRLNWRLAAFSQNLPAFSFGKITNKLYQACARRLIRRQYVHHSDKSVMLL
jgi:hypothetical protein